MNKVNIVQQCSGWVMITSKSIIFDLSRQQFDADPDGVNAESVKSMFVSTIFEIIKENYDK